MKRRSNNEGAPLKEARLGAGLTQVQVVERVKANGVVSLSEPHYRRIEAGRSTPTILIAIEIANALGSDVYDFWG